MFFDGRRLKATCRLPKHILLRLLRLMYPLKTLAGLDTKKGQSILKGLEDLEVLSLYTVETRFLWPSARLSLRPLMGHVDHSVICRDFQPGRNGMVCIICKLMTCRNLEIGELSKLIIICSDHLLLMFALGAFLAQNKQNSLFTDCVWEKNARSPRNLALSVCRTTFPRFSETSGGWATSTMDPSAARILDPLRRS